MKKIFIFTIIVLFLLSTASVATALSLKQADVGNFNDYDSSGGGWDWGGSSGGWDWSGSGSGWDLGTGYALGSLFGGGSGIVGFIIFVVIIMLIANSAKRRAGSRPVNAPQGGYPTVFDNTNIIVPAIQQVDPNYSNEKFIIWTKEVFITLQQAWMARDWSKIRPFEKEELYNLHQSQLQEYINAGRINKLERINVNQAYLSKYERDAQYENLTVFMAVRMSDYIIDERTNAVLKGDPNQEYFLQYLLTFMRRKGVLTDAAKSNRSTVACPHCGAPTNITSAGKCEYCGFIVTTGEHDWVLSNMVGVKPGMFVDNSGLNIRDAE